VIIKKFKELQKLGMLILNKKKNVNYNIHFNTPNNI